MKAILFFYNDLQLKGVVWSFSLKGAFKFFKANLPVINLIINFLIVIAFKPNNAASAVEKVVVKKLINRFSLITGVPSAS